MVTPLSIKTLRTSLGMNTTQFGSLVGVTANAVARWEIGDRHPRYETALKIVALLAQREKDLARKAKRKAAAK